MVTYRNKTRSSCLIKTNLYSIDAKYIQLSDIDNNKLFEESSQTWHKRLHYDNTQSMYEDTEFNYEGVESKKLIDKIQNATGMSVYNIWTHKHEHNESTQIHNHWAKEHDFSFVYYVRVPDNAGKIVFQLNKHCNQSWFEPKESMLYVFPNWLDHYVTKNLSNEIRLSISGNLTTR